MESERIVREIRLYGVDAGPTEKNADWHQKIFCPNLTQPYMGHTGYSTKENVNNIEITHLHWGLQLIFDESQREGSNEIWVDVYPLTRFLAKHTQAAAKVEGTKEWVRTADIVDPAVEEYEEGQEAAEQDADA